jgi:hypothetical protein
LGFLFTEKYAVEAHLKIAGQFFVGTQFKKM